MAIEILKQKTKFTYLWVLNDLNLWEALRILLKLLWPAHPVIELLIV